MLTFGVEEEYLLVDPGTGAPVPRAEEVLLAADLRPALLPSEAQHELLQVQLEVATPVCHDLAAAARHLRRMRAALNASAAQWGCRIVAVGGAPFAADGPVPVTDQDRYRTARAQAPQLVDDLMLNGMHVHVGVEDEDERVAALDRIRPWLPVLVAMTGNSPLWSGADTEFASWRTIHFDRWPVSGPPPSFRDAADYRHRVRALLDTGVIRDAGRLYWMARLSERYPTVEVRAADVQLTVADAELVAGVIRGLVASAVLAERRGDPRPEPPEELLRAAVWHAAHDGLATTLVSARDGVARPAGAVLEELREYLAPGLDLTGDTRAVDRLWRDFTAAGTGADRQRRWFRESGREGLTKHLLDCAVAG
ncbi:glutamate--cysteine ligase [Kitasatospora sp. NPDC088346]|uniref:carboxylate-amine ligase n=1 Tax=Kitasatospora sp. NPDC088346 TaxID=3364073 RepID=UPI0038309EEB